MRNRLVGLALVLFSLLACLWIVFGTSASNGGEVAGVDMSGGLPTVPRASAAHIADADARIQPKPFRRDIRVQGKVCDTQQRPLSGAHVRWRDDPTVVVSTELSGAFVIQRGSDAAWPADLEVTKTGYCTRVLGLGMEDGEVIEVLLTAEPNGLHALKLTVLRAPSEPLKHFQTTMLKSVPAGSQLRPFSLPSSAAHEAQDGSVLLTTTHTCIDLLILADGLEPVNREGLDLTTSTPDHPLLLELTLRRGARVSGNVELPGGVPTGEMLEIALIPKGFVTLPDTSPGSQVAPVLLAAALRSKSARLTFIGDRAIFVLEGVAEGDYGLVVLDATRSFVSPRLDVSVVAASTHGPFSLQADLGVAVTVKVVMGSLPVPCDGSLHSARQTVEAPVEGVRRHLDPARARPAATQFAQSGSDGRLVFAHVPAGEYRLNISLDKRMSEHPLWNVNPALASELGQLVVNIIPDVGNLDVARSAPTGMARELVVDLSTTVEAFNRWRRAKGRSVVQAELSRHGDIIHERDQHALARNGIAIKDLPFYSIERRLGAIERRLSYVENSQGRLSPEFMTAVSEGDVAALIKQVLCTADPPK